MIKSKWKRTMSMPMIFVMLLFVAALSQVMQVEAESYTYDAGAAVAYAQTHWNDGEGLCAEFVSNCLQAGGFSEPYNKNAKQLGINLQKYGERIEYCGTNYYSYFKQSDWSKPLVAGDIIVWTYPEGCGSSGHVVLVSGALDDQSRICVYAHNQAKNNQPTCLTTDYTATDIYAIHLNGTSPDTVKFVAVNSNGFSAYWKFANCSQVVVKIKSSALNQEVGSLTLSNDYTYNFSVGNSSWGNEFEVRLIPDGNESRTHYLRYGDKENLVVLPSNPNPSGDDTEEDVIKWANNGVTSNGFSVYWNFTNCSQVVVKIKSSVLNQEVGSLTLGNDYTYNFSVGNSSWGNEFEVRLIPDGDESRTHYLRFGDKENLVVLPVPDPTGIIPGDLDGNHEVNSDDAVYLLYHTLLPDSFPVDQDVDYDGNGKVDSNDAIYLLYHTLLPDQFPLR